MSRNVVGLERLMLESNGFDFRNRYPQKLVAKLAKSASLDRNTAAMVAYNISLDLYRTYAPLKQTTQTMGLACVELAARIFDADLRPIIGGQGFDYQRWSVTRGEVMGTFEHLFNILNTDTNIYRNYE